MAGIAAGSADLRTANTLSAREPAGVTSPRSVKEKPVPASRSITARDAVTSCKSAAAAIAAAAFSRGVSEQLMSNSPMCTPARAAMRDWRAIAITDIAHWTARPGPSNVATR